jgi:hypothetical protein
LLKESCDLVTADQQKHAALSNNRKFLHHVLVDKLASIDGGNVQADEDSDLSNDFGPDPLALDDQAF